MANSMNLTVPQQKVFDFAMKHDGQIEAALLKKKGLDVRAANNLVNAGLMTLTNGVYRIKGFKKPAKGETPSKSEKRQGVSEAVTTVLDEEEEDDLPGPFGDDDEDMGDPENDEGAEDDPRELEDKEEVQWGARSPEEADMDEAPKSEPRPKKAAKKSAEKTTAKKAPKQGTTTDDRTEIAILGLMLKLTPEALREAIRDVCGVDVAAFVNPLDGLTESDLAKLRAALKERADAKPKRPSKAEKIVNASGECLCGCGLQVGTKRRFAAGHDAKLHSLVLRVSRGQASRDELPVSEASKEYLRGAPWMKRELAEAIGL